MGDGPGQSWVRTGEGGGREWPVAQEVEEEEEGHF